MFLFIFTSFRLTGLCVSVTGFVPQSLLWYLRTCATSNPAVLSQGTLSPWPGGGKTWPRRRRWSHRKESVLGRRWTSLRQERSDVLAVIEPSPRWFWKLVHAQRGFETFPAFSVSFSKRGGILGFQSLVFPTNARCRNVQVHFPPVCSETWPWSRKASFEQRPKDAEKRALHKPV